MLATKHNRPKAETLVRRGEFTRHMDGSEGGVVTVVEGSRVDVYFVRRELDSCEVSWHHATDAGRRYTVVCSAGSGEPVACDCPWSVRFPDAKPCKHKRETRNLMADGLLANGPEPDGYPDGWGWSDELAEAESDYWQAVQCGPRVTPHRV